MTLARAKRFFQRRNEEMEAVLTISYYSNRLTAQKTRQVRHEVLPQGVAIVAALLDQHRRCGQGGDGPARRLEGAEPRPRPTVYPGLSTAGDRQRPSLSTMMASRNSSDKGMGRRVVLSI